MKKRKWKRRAKALRHDVDAWARLASERSDTIMQYHADVDRLWGIVGEEDGDRNESGVMNLAVVLERRMAELRQLRHVAMLRPEPEARVCLGRKWWFRPTWSRCRDFPEWYNDLSSPCATMTGCAGEAECSAKSSIVTAFDPRGDTDPCGVL